MGNLVTNRINFTRRDGTTGLQAFAEAVANLTPAPIASVAAALEGSAGARRRVSVPLSMELVSPIAQGFDTDGKGSIERGLAILSTPGRDLVGAYWEARDPFSNDLPPHLMRTAYTVLSQLGLADLDPEVRAAHAQATRPHDLAAGQAALKLFEKTGQFEETVLREKTWGTRAHGEDVCLWLEEGNLCVTFDTVNAGPSGWIEELAAALPAYAFDGVSFDEDADYSLHFETDDPGEVYIEERDDPNGVLVARAIVSGMTVEELRAEDDDLDDDDMGYEP